MFPLLDVRWLPKEKDIDTYSAGGAGGRSPLAGARWQVSLGGSQDALPFSSPAAAGGTKRVAEYYGYGETDRQLVT